MLKITPRLDDDTENLIHRVIGCCIRVHRELGPDLLKVVYRRSLCVEFQHSRLSFQSAKRLPVLYRGVVVQAQRLDLVVEDRVLLELKSVDRLAPVHQAQVISYLKVSGLRVGPLVNFNVRILPHGLRRIIV